MIVVLRHMPPLFHIVIPDHISVEFRGKGHGGNPPASPLCSDLCALIAPPSRLSPSLVTGGKWVP